MLHGRQRGHSQNGIVQTLRQACLTGRLSPQQSLKKVGPVITEVLCTSVRPKGGNGHPDNLKERKPRLNNANSILSVGERTNAERGPNQRGPVSHTSNKETVGAQQMRVNPLKPAPPNISPAVSNGQAPVSRILTPEKRGSLPPPPPVGKDVVKIQFPGPNRGRRISKALPSIPPPVPSPRKAAFASPRSAFMDPFRTRRDKIVRGHGTPIVPTAPDMREKSGSSASGYSSGSAYSSAESTWNMINNMMRAVSEEEVQQARKSRIRTSSGSESKGSDKRPSYVEFPKMRSSQEGWSSDTHTWSGRTARTSSMVSSSTYCSSVPLKDEEDQQDKDVSLARRGSIASVFSIVIQPTRERSNEARDALVPAESFPSRIKDILHDVHDGVESTLCARKWTVSRSHSPEDSELDPDVAMAINSLRVITVDDVLFD